MRDSSKRAARAVGVLFIAGTLAGIASAALTGSSSDDAEYLARIAANKDLFRIAGLLVLVMGFSLAFIPIVINPVLRKQNEFLATAYLVFRGAIETGLYIALALTWFVLVETEGHDGTVRDLFLRAQGLIFGVLLPMAFSIGAIVLYIALFRSRLVPRWISVFGMVAVLIAFATGMLALFGVLSVASEVNTAMNLPIALQEMLMAVWLIAKGFNTKVTA